MDEDSDPVLHLGSGSEIDPGDYGFDYEDFNEDDFEPVAANPIPAKSAKAKGKERQVIELDDDDDSDDAPPSTSAYVEDDERITKLHDEIKSIDEQIAELTSLRQNLAKDRDRLKKEASAAPATKSVQAVKKDLAAIDYTQTGLKHTTKLLRKLTETWGYDSFRQSQEGCCNAVLDQRDLICLMATGGGKSLCYQLPSLLAKGVTVVISPLLALISDQVHNLQEVGVEAVSLTGSTDKTESNEIMKRLEKGAEPAISLIYVTPEKVAKSKKFTSCLQKIYESGRLARFVVDEAHCASSLGHDFRPDYRQLGLLRTLMPKVPITAVTATCPKTVLADIIKILKLPKVTNSDQANSTGTILFTAPLHRPNLRYQVVPKPQKAAEAIEAIAEWITERHAGENGIVYCLSQKDCVTVAEGLRTASDNKIKSGIYHAALTPEEKERIHNKFRSKKVHVVCATIAFGLGIDIPNTRFVIHHTMSKSLEGLYQESGRAGRDGKEADCIVFYKPSVDIPRLASLTCRDTEGMEKLLPIIRYAQDTEACRSVTFSKYFDARSAARFSTAESFDACGNCDNCLRDLDAFENRDCTEDAWKICTAVKAIIRENGRVTVPQLGEVVRGLNKGMFGTAGKSAGKSILEMSTINGKVSLNKEDCESLICSLIASGHLGFLFSSTAYQDIPYIQAGSLTTSLTRFSASQLANAPRYHVRFSKGKKKTRKAKASSSGAKRKRAQDDEEIAEDDWEEVVEVDSKRKKTSG